MSPFSTQHATMRRSRISGDASCVVSINGTDDVLASSLTVSNLVESDDDGDEVL